MWRLRQAKASTKGEAEVGWNSRRGSNSKFSQQKSPQMRAFLLAEYRA
jgi:hypothetical protein